MQLVTSDCVPDDLANAVEKLTHKGVQVRISPFDSDEEKPPEMVAPTVAEIQSAESELASVTEENEMASKAFRKPLIFWILQKQKTMPVV